MFLLKGSKATNCHYMSSRCL